MAEFLGTLTVRDEQSGLSFEVPLTGVDIRCKRAPVPDVCGSIESIAFTGAEFIINVDALVTDLRERICAALGVPAAVLMPKPGADLELFTHQWEKVRVGDKHYVCPTYRATPVPLGTCIGVATAPGVVEIGASTPAALTQAELEALKPGPRPNGGYCETCRLCPPYGYVNAEGTLFYCDGCFSKMVKK